MVRAAGRRRLHNAPGGGGRSARGPSATEIAKTYYVSRPSAPRPLRDMCANEREDVPRRAIDSHDDDDGDGDRGGGRWTVVRRV